jgi:hypothetical protein
MGVPMKKEGRPAVDNFEGWEDGIEGHERPQGAGIIQGVLLKFGNDAAWTTRDQEEISPDLELVVVDLARVTQRWQDGQAVETRILEPGEKFPDVDAMNEAIPRTEWIEGPTGEPRGPWQNQHLVYLLDLQTMDRFTFATGTTGGRIAVRELRDKLVWMRRLRGPNVYATVTLGDTFMPTKFGGRQRPHFTIVRWVRLGSEVPVEAAALPAPAETAALPLVESPPVAEDLNDDLPDDLAPPKPAKVVKVGKHTKVG